MELADILSDRAVLACKDIKNKNQLLELLADHAADLTGEDAATLVAAIKERESLGSTGLGNGIAIPHGKIPGLSGVVAVFARLDPPLEFDAVDDQPVDLVVMLLAPMGAGADHLKALARVARILRTESVVEELRRTDDPEKLHAILTAPVASHQAA